MKILIVEDDKKIASFLKKGLEDTYQCFLDKQIDYRMGN